MVSFMFTGAGSVEVSARPALPTAYSTSGKLLRISSSLPMMARASSIEIAGSVTGMYIRSPSFSGGMNFALLNETKSIFRNHNARIDQHADSDRNSGKRHQVRADTHVIHEEKCQQHRERKRYGYDQD